MMIARIEIEFREPGGQERLRTAPILAAAVMKRSGDLNESLQEGFFQPGLEQPQFLPDFVGLKKLVRVEKCNAALELFAFFHRVLSRFTLESYFGPASSPA